MAEEERRRQVVMEGRRGGCRGRRLAGRVGDYFGLPEEGFGEVLAEAGGWRGAGEIICVRIFEPRTSIDWTIPRTLASVTERLDNSRGSSQRRQQNCNQAWRQNHKKKQHENIGLGREIDDQGDRAEKQNYEPESWDPIGPMPLKPGFGTGNIGRGSMRVECGRIRLEDGFLGGCQVEVVDHVLKHAAALFGVQRLKRLAD